MINFITDDGAILQLDAQRYIDDTRLDAADVDAMAQTIRETISDAALLELINGTLTAADVQLRKAGHLEGVKGLCLLDQLTIVARELFVCGYEQALDDVQKAQQETALETAC